MGILRSFEQVHARQSHRLETMDVNVFRKLKIFEGLSTSELQNLAARMRPLRIKRSQTVVVEGMPANDLYVLLSGVVKVSATNSATGPC